MIRSLRLDERMCANPKKSGFLRVYDPRLVNLALLGKWSPCYFETIGL